MRTAFLLLFGPLLLFSTVAFEAADRTQGVVQLAKDVTPEMLTTELQGLARDIELRPIFAALDLYAVSFTEVRDKEVFSTLIQAGLISGWQHDRPVFQRTTFPDDALYVEQWNMEKIGMPLAWDQTTGGSTPHGDEIVVAILDTGFESDHVDLVDNIWTNPAEIDGDGIDNDGNGYIDDFLGLNIDTGNDDHAVTDHGTGVSGLIGARGDNGIGIAGVNWTVKLLLISGISSESEIIEAYQYIKSMRDLYHASSGEQGAFIVSTNLSLGIDRAQAEDHPLWCGVYDELGSSGIMNVSATTNKDVNVDILGDMPSTCPSEYLIVVTNTNENDAKVTNAGFGTAHVDLGAPGNGSLSTDLNDDYGMFPGTSASAPHVTGTLALLYSVPCPSLLVDLENQPDLVARRMREFVLASVDPVSSLASISATGGRLNTAAAIDAAQKFCGAVSGPLEIFSMAPNPTRNEITIEYETPDNQAYDFKIYNSLGQEVDAFLVQPPLFGPKSYTYDAGSLGAGLYYLSIQLGKARVTQAFTVF